MSKKKNFKEDNYPAIEISNGNNDRLKFADLDELGWELNFDYKRDLIELIGMYETKFVVHSISSN
jgi:hypothetical protein